MLQESESYHGGKVMLRISCKPEPMSRNYRCSSLVRAGTRGHHGQPAPAKVVN